MSKRFGRNQRRALRQRVADLEQSHVLDRELLRHSSNERQKLEAELVEWDERVRQLLGQDSAYRRAPMVHAETGYHGETFQAHMQQPLLDYPMHEASPIAHKMECFHETMNQLSTAVEHDFNKQARKMWLIVGGRDVGGYYVSDSALHSYGVSAHAVEHLTRDALRQMAAQYTCSLRTV